MYTLMNKNTPLIDFHWEGIEGVAIVPVVDKVYSQPWFISNLRDWLERRSVTKHREHMRELLTRLGLTDTKSIIDFSKGLSLTDTLWVNVDDKFQWDKVNLFQNEFDEVIERIAFDGGMYGQHFSTTSPEFGTNGTYAKCWHRESDGVYLYKQGSTGAANAGYEIYSEMYASDLLDALGYPHARYDLIRYRGKLVSRCKLFTSEQEMLLPLATMVERELGGLQFGFIDVIELCKKHYWAEQLAEYLITDALILNEDRHLGNIGVICDADTFKVKRLSPIYDNGVSFCCFYRKHLESADLVGYAKTRTPSLYPDFIRGALAVAGREQIKKLEGLASFKFRTDSKYALEPERVRQLEQIVQIQAEKLLTGDGGSAQQPNAFGRLNS